MTTLAKVFEHFKTLDSSKELDRTTAEYALVLFNSGRDDNLAYDYIFEQESPEFKSLKLLVLNQEIQNNIAYYQSDSDAIQDLVWNRKYIAYLAYRLADYLPTHYISSIDEAITTTLEALKKLYQKESKEGIIEHVVEPESKAVSHLLPESYIYDCTDLVDQAAQLFYYLYDRTDAIDIHNILRCYFPNRYTDKEDN